MKFAMIENGIVTNVILTSQEFVTENNISGVFSDIASVGDTYEGGVFTKPEQAIEAPRQVTPLQMRRALRVSGYLDSVVSMISQAPDEVKDAWEYATYFDRDDELIGQYASVVNLSESQVDQIFILASSFN